MERLAEKTSGIFNFADYKKNSAKAGYCLMIFLLSLAAVAAIAPPVWLFLSSFKEAEELTAVPYRLLPENFRIGKIADVWGMINFGKYFLNTLVVVVGAVGSAVLFNGLLAYALSVLKPLGHRLVYGMVLAGYMIPAITSIVPLYKMIVNWNLINSYIPLALVFGANAFYLIMFKNYFDSLPQALFEAARVDGCNRARMFFSIVLPLSRPIVGVVSIFAMTAAWSDFLLPYLVLQQDRDMTIMVKIYDLQSTMGTVTGFGPDKLLMVLTISILPQILLFVLFQKQITGNAVSVGIKE